MNYRESNFQQPAYCRRLLMMRMVLPGSKLQLFYPVAVIYVHETNPIPCRAGHHY